ncbi:hypothetical protein GOP47_0021884 [Adiantum capillus-veneris]|uniref:4-coumarate--CoA ligase n=1 Tax=Adiantum capillus-veneris TaxID=13818 RepID=A0A9D4Z7C5_ADICA|nr:hypothetical protein GOP47_0021884 [Adiantum capillus-veneris]
MAAANIDPKSGFCAATGTYTSKRERAHLPSDPSLTLPTFILHRPTLNPSAIAYIDATTGTSLSYGDLKTQVFSVAAGLSSFGVQPGDVVLVLSPNSIALGVIVLAIMACGAIVTTTNPLNTPAEIAKQASDSKAKFVASLPSLLAKLPKLPLILLRDLCKDDLDSLPLHGKLARANLELDRNGSALVIAKLGFPRFCTFSELLLSKSQIALPHSGRQDDVAALLYSSGTTGASKGVILTHRNFIAQGSTVVVQQKFDFVETLAAVQKFRITHMPVVPPILIALAKSPMVQKFDLSSLCNVGSGAGPLGKEVMDAFSARFPNVVIPQGYGMTESTAVGAHTARAEETKHYGSTGLIAANTEFKIVDVDSGLPLPPNQRGEIWMRGPTIMKGYFGRPGETAAVIDKEGWLHTGDLGYIDSEGYLFIVDRLKELIKYKGLQVPPAELEAVLLSHPKIMDAAVIPFPDKEAGQIPLAFVVRNPESTLTEEDVKKFVADQVAPYKKVRKVAFVTSIPKSSAGKILRKDLVQIASSKL